MPSNKLEKTFHFHLFMTNQKSLSQFTNCDSQHPKLKLNRRMEDNHLCTDSATTVRKWRKVDLMDLAGNVEADPEVDLAT